MFAPFATVPAQLAIPESASVQVKSACVVLPWVTTAPSAGVVREIVGAVVSGTVYVPETVDEFPATSVASTVKVCVPYDVSIVAPFGTVPSQYPIPDPSTSSSQA